VEVAREKIDQYTKRDDIGEKEHCTKESLKFAASTLVEQALTKRSMDNITAMIVSWKFT
jgi:protein phosphatase 1L